MIDTITPLEDSVIAPGDSFSFAVDDTYTTLTIQVETLGGYEYAYDSSLGGAQTGYTVSVVAAAGRHTFTVARSAGFDTSPFDIIVDEDESGSPATTTFSYALTVDTPFPQDDAPYFGDTVGALIITDSGGVVRDDVGLINIVGATVTDLGNGKVRITFAGGGGGGKFVTYQTGQIGLNIGSWQGPDLYNWHDNAQNGNYGVVSGDPAIDAVTMGQVLPTAGTVTEVVASWRTNGGTAEGTLELWRFRLVDDSAAAVTGVQVGVLATLDGTQNTARRYVEKVTLSEAVLAGDLLVALYKSSVMQSATLYYSCAWTIET